jgi:uncharacterized membrane protein YozB (DUF420 family)
MSILIKYFFEIIIFTIFSAVLFFILYKSKVLFKDEKNLYEVQDSEDEIFLKSINFNTRLAVAIGFFVIIALFFLEFKCC